MLHRVIREVDMGTPILVREIPFIKGVDDDLEALEKRLHEIEWGVVVEGINIAIDQLRQSGKEDDPTMTK